MKLTKDLVNWKLEEEISRKETELARVRTEYEGLKAKVNLEVDAENNKQSWLDNNGYKIKRHYRSQFNSYEHRINQLTTELRELKNRRK